LFDLQLEGDPTAKGIENERLLAVQQEELQRIQKEINGQCSRKKSGKLSK
jgi:hypothetical protein